MGMDVYGKAPINETGEYYRQSVWGWRPLWNYCLMVAPIAHKVQYGHSNDGDGLNAADSVILADLLEQELTSGRTADALMMYELELEALPDEFCNICAGTGKRLPPPVCGAGDQPCNGCQATGRRRPFETYYHTSVEDIQEFVAFLRASGGFEIH